MARFGRRSTERLDTCDPLLRKLFGEVVKSYDCIILDGHRDRQTQNRLWKEGKTKLRFPHSKHNVTPSRAVDVAPYHAQVPHVRWDDTAQFYRFGGYVLRVAEELGIRVRWGGDWDGDGELHDQTFIDLPHWELV